MSYIIRYILFIFQYLLYIILMSLIITVPLVAFIWGFDLHGPRKPDR